MPLFYKVTTKEGKRSLISVGAIFAFIDNGKSSIAISLGGATMEVDAPLDEIAADIEEMNDGDDDAED